MLVRTNTIGKLVIRITKSEENSQERLKMAPSWLGSCPSYYRCPLMNHRKGTGGMEDLKYSLGNVQISFPQSASKHAGMQVGYLCFIPESIHVFSRDQMTGTEDRQVSQGKILE